MDSRTNDRPRARWVEVATAGGGTRLEMRWGVDRPEAVPAPAAASAA